MLKQFAPYAAVALTAAGLACFAARFSENDADEGDVIQPACEPDATVMPGELRFGIVGRDLVRDGNRAQRLGLLPPSEPDRYTIEP